MGAPRIASRDPTLAAVASCPPHTCAPRTAHGRPHDREPGSTLAAAASCSSLTSAPGRRLHILVVASRDRDRLGRRPEGAARRCRPPPQAFRAHYTALSLPSEDSPRALHDRVRPLGRSSEGPARPCTTPRKVLRGPCTPLQVFLPPGALLLDRGLSPRRSRTLAAVASCSSLTSAPGTAHRAPRDREAGPHARGGGVVLFAHKRAGDGAHILVIASRDPTLAAVASCSSLTSAPGTAPPHPRDREPGSHARGGGVVLFAHKRAGDGAPTSS